MKAIFMKMKIEKVKDFINKEIDKTTINKDLEKNGYKLYNDTGYHNGKTTLTYSIHKKDRVDSLKHSAIEIQVEAGQYRYMVRMVDKNNNKTYKDAFKIFSRTRFFNEKYDRKINNKIHGNTSSMKEISCKYKGKTSGTLAIYQYYNLKQKTTYNQLSKKIIADLIKVKNLLKRLKIKRFIEQ